MASDDGLTRDELLVLVEEQQIEIDNMRHDWAAMNRFVNTQATAFGWCDEYEERLYKHNSEFIVLKAHGRVPEGARVMSRNVYAARRLTMGHVMSIFERLGIELPTEAWAGVVRDPKALEAAKDVLIERLAAKTKE